MSEEELYFLESQEVAIGWREGVINFYRQIEDYNYPKHTPTFIKNIWKYIHRDIYNKNNKKKEIIFNITETFKKILRIKDPIWIESVDESKYGFLEIELCSTGKIPDKIFFDKLKVEVKSRFTCKICGEMLTAVDVLTPEIKNICEKCNK